MDVYVVVMLSVYIVLSFEIVHIRSIALLGAVVIVATTAIIVRLTLWNKK
jgi:hypothetical protein